MSPDKRIEQIVERTLALMSDADQALLSPGSKGSAIFLKQQRIAMEQYDAAMASVLAELSDEELATLTARCEETVAGDE